MLTFCPICFRPYLSKKTLNQEDDTQIPKALARTFLPPSPQKKVYDIFLYDFTHLLHKYVH